MEAWQYGPVIRTLYHEVRKYGDRPVTEPLKDMNPHSYELEVAEIPNDELGKEARETIAQVWGIYGRMSASQLSNLTHQTGTPWSKVMSDAGGGDIPKYTYISTEAIQDHFQDLLLKLTEDSAGSG